MIKKISNLLVIIIVILTILMTITRINLIILPIIVLIIILLILVAIEIFIKRDKLIGSFNNEEKLIKILIIYTIIAAIIEISTTFNIGLFSSLGFLSIIIAKFLEWLHKEEK